MKGLSGSASSYPNDDTPMGGEYRTSPGGKSRDTTGSEVTRFWSISMVPYVLIVVHPLTSHVDNMASKPFYSLIIAAYPDADNQAVTRLGEINVDWVDFTREKSSDRPPSPPLPIMKPSSSRRRNPNHKPIPGSSITNGPSSGHSKAANGINGAHGNTPDDLSLQPLLGHVPGPNPLDTSSASGISTFGRGIVHLFRHAPPPTLIASLDAHPLGESSSSAVEEGDWAGERAEGEDGSLIAILAVPAWMRPADFLEFIGGWATCLEGVRMIRYELHPARAEEDC